MGLFQKSTTALIVEQNEGEHAHERTLEKR